MKKNIPIIAAVLLLAVGAYYFINRAGSNQQIQAAGQYPGKIKVGHLVGICMSPLFLAHAQGYFKEEGVDVELVWMQNPGDSAAALNSGGVQFIHNPFTNTYQANANGANLRIISGSGNGGLVVIAQADSGIKTLADLKAKAKTGLKVGSQRINTLEMTFYRTIANLGLTYDDFEMKWFTDHFSMLAAFENKDVQVVTHVEPYATMLTDKYGGIRVATSFDAWGPNTPDCVVSAHADTLTKYPDTVRRYLRAILRADAFIKSHEKEAVEILDKNKYYKVDGPTLAASLPRQLPGVDLREGAKGMDVAIGDMVGLKYLKTKPEGVVDFTILQTAIKELADQGAQK